MSKTSAAIGLQLGGPFSQGDYELARATIVECCRATRRVRTRNSEGKIGYVDEADYATRLAAARVIAEFVVGKPIAMSITANLNQGHNQQTTDAFIGDLLKDAGSVRAMQDVLGKMIEAAQRVQPVDIVAKEAGDNATAGDAP